VDSQSNKFNLFNSNVSLAIGLLVIQQLIVASSTIWITLLIAGIQQGSFSYSLLGLYLAALLLPYLPGGLALIEITKAKMRANIQYIDNFANIYRGHISEWSNATQHSKTASILTSEAQQTINGFFDYVYRFASCGLNVALNLIIIAVILDYWLLASYAIGISLAFLILKYQKKIKTVLSLKSQNSRIKWISMLLKAWDNVLINNLYNYSIWQEKTRQRGKRLVGSGVKLEYLSQGVSIGMALVLFAPTFALIAYLPIIYEFDLTALAIMVVALPRLFQVLSYSYELLYVLADFPMQKSRMKTVKMLLESPNLSDAEQAYQKLEKRIFWDKIQLAFNTEPVSPKTILESLSSKGRYTIKGENGSGKSSLLLLIKMIKEREAFYLPVKHDLVFNGSIDHVSTGQSVKKVLQEVLEKLDTPIILLDEWDANLDTINKHKLSEIIDQISQKKCVIEVRHK